MPTYEYRCSSCGEHVEVFQSISDDPLEQCGICGGRLLRVFHPVGIVFKGSGFYSTDSRRRAPVGSSSATNPSSEHSAAKSEGAGSDGSKDAGSEKSSGQETKIA